MVHRLGIADLTLTLRDGARSFTVQSGTWLVEPGDVVALTGGSGTGKTLLLEMLGLLRAPDGGAYGALGDQGAIEFHHFWSAPDAIARCAAARADIFGFVPQAGGLLPYLSVQENIALTQEISGRRDPRWITGLLDALDLAAIAALRPGELSIGQRQRVAIARALAHRPFCVIADEPTAALDPDNARRALGLLIDTARQSGSAAIISSHDHAALAHFDTRRLGLAITSAPGDPAVISRLSDISGGDAEAAS